MNKNFLMEQIKKHYDAGLRLDGRELGKYRDVSIEYGISHNAEASALVKLGKTKVVAGIKLKLDKPFEDTPDQGILMVGAEFSQIADDHFESGPPSPRAIEVARVVDRGIRESKCIDVQKLCIRVGELVWSVYVDLYILDNDGNLIDACALAAIAALKRAKLPVIKDNKINYDEHTDENLPVTKTPIAFTFVKVGEHLLVDPTSDEEEAASAAITIAMSTDDLINGMQKQGYGGMTIEEVMKCINDASSMIKERQALVEVK